MAVSGWRRRFLGQMTDKIVPQRELARLSGVGN
jgi:hypothetical protein